MWGPLKYLELWDLNISRVTNRRLARTSIELYSTCSSGREIERPNERPGWGVGAIGTGKEKILPEGFTTPLEPASSSMVKPEKPRRGTDLAPGTSSGSRNTGAGVTADNCDDEDDGPPALIGSSEGESEDFLGETDKEGEEDEDSDSLPDLVSDDTDDTDDEGVGVGVADKDDDDRPTFEGFKPGFFGAPAKKKEVAKKATEKAAEPPKPKPAPEPASTSKLEPAAATPSEDDMPDLVSEDGSSDDDDESDESDGPPPLVDDDSSDESEDSDSMPPLVSASEDSDTDASDDEITTPGARAAAEMRAAAAAAASKKKVPPPKPKPKPKPKPQPPKLKDIFEVTQDKLSEVISRFEGAIGPGNREWSSSKDGDMVLQVLKIDKDKDGRTKLALSDGVCWHWFKYASPPRLLDDIDDFCLVNVLRLNFTGETTSDAIEVYPTRVTASAAQLVQRYTGGKRTDPSTLPDPYSALTQGRRDMRDRYDNPNNERDVVLLLRQSKRGPRDPTVGSAAGADRSSRRPVASSSGSSALTKEEKEEMERVETIRAEERRRADELRKQEEREEKERREAEKKAKKSAKRAQQRARAKQAPAEMQQRPGGPSTPSGGAGGAAGKGDLETRLSDEELDKMLYDRLDGLMAQLEAEGAKEKAAAVVAAQRAAQAAQREAAVRRLREAEEAAAAAEAAAATAAAAAAAAAETADRGGHDDDDDDNEGAMAFARRQPAAAPEKSTPINPADALESIADLAWECEMSRDAMREWELLESADCARVYKKLHDLASGHWVSNDTDVIDGKNKIFKTRFSKSGRILWERGVAFSKKLQRYTEVLRIWNVVVDHDAQEDAIKNIQDSHRKGLTCNEGVRRRVRLSAPVDQRDADGVKVTLPRVDIEAGCAGADAPGVEEVTVVPPVCAGADSYVLLKFYEMSHGLVRSLLDSRCGDSEYAFRMSETEHAVCRLNPDPPESILLIGRSGTGKTTCLLYRMFLNYHAYWRSFFKGTRVFDGGHSHHNQLFVTSNPVLRAEVRRYFTGMVAGCSADEVSEGGGEDGGVAPLPYACPPGESSGLPGHSLSGLGDKGSFPLFLTKREWLVALDGVVDEPFFDRDDSGMLTAAAATHAWGRNYSADMMMEMPEAYVSDLDEYDDAYYYDVSTNSSGTYAANRLGGGGGGGGVGDEGGNGGGVGGGGDAGPAAGAVNAQYAHHEQMQRRRHFAREIDYDVFAAEVFPKLSVERAARDAELEPGQIPANLAPSLVWAEITSFIKGSADALSAFDPADVSGSGSECVLSLEGYTELGRKMSPNFTDSRPLIYRLWEQYEKVKRQMEAYDACDVVAHVYKRVVSKGLMPHAAPVHRAYVDEVQDFTSGELLLMCRTVEDPNGLFLTGDTAQTIARGLSFRFQDITTIFKHLEDKAFRGIHGNAALGVKKPQQIHKLVNNFRTHSGILDVANLLVNVLCKFFPYSIDNLQPDRGLFPGPVPWLLNATTYEDLQVLLLGSNRGNAQIEFGAQQCIIVREQASKDRLPPDLRSGLVCTVFESKGLEFEDVLIYNFFKDSPAQKEWRCLYDFHEKYGGGGDDDDAAAAAEEGSGGASGLTSSTIPSDAVDVSSTNEGGGGASSASRKKTGIALDPDIKKRLIKFDAGQHKLLLEELRHLYTAVTRARVRVWVYDEDVENRQPMWWLLSERKLAKVINSVLEQEVLGLTKGAKTTEAEWADQGKSLYDKAQYALAATCFTKAGAGHAGNAALARGKALQKQAPEGGEDDAQRNRRFRNAAETFLEAKTATLLAPPAEGDKDKDVSNAAQTMFPADIQAVQLAAQALSQGDSTDNKYAGRLFESVARTRHAIKCYKAAGMQERAGHLLVAERRPAEAAEMFKIALGRIANATEQAETAAKFVDELAVCVPGGLAQAVEMAITFMGKGNQGYIKAMELLTAAETEGKYGGKAEVARSKSTPASVGAMAARALIRAGQRKEAVDLLAKLPDVGRAVDWLRTTNHPDVLADLFKKLDRPGDEAAVRIELGDLTEAAHLLKQASRAAAAAADSGGDEGDDQEVDPAAAAAAAAEKKSSDKTENLRARCLLASAAQQYLAPEDAVADADTFFNEIKSLLAASKDAFMSSGDADGVERTRQETEVVKGIVAATDAVGGDRNLAKNLTETMRRLGDERDGWGVALLVQATPPAARALLGHEGWQGAITAVAQTAESLLRAGGAQANTLAAQVAKSKRGSGGAAAAGVVVGGGGGGGGKIPQPLTTTVRRREITGMRPLDREVLRVAMSRLRLTDDEVNLAGQYIFEPSLNPWLGAALADVPGGGGDDDDDDALSLNRDAFKAALDAITTQAVPGPQGTLKRMTPKAPLCLRLGVALLHRARAWSREAVAAGEKVVARVNAATSGDAAERKDAAAAGGSSDRGAATVTELLHAAYLLDHLREIDGMHAQFVGTITPASETEKSSSSGPLGNKKGGKVTTQQQQQQHTKRQQEKEARAIAAAVAAEEEWSAHIQTVRDSVVEALGKQLIASHLGRWHGAPSPPADARAAELIRDHFSSSKSAGIRRLVSDLCPASPSAQSSGSGSGELGVFFGNNLPDVDALLDAMHLHSLALPSLSVHWRNILKQAVNRAKELSQPPRDLIAVLDDPKTSNTKKKKTLAEVKEGAPARARYLAHAALLMAAPIFHGNNNSGGGKAATERWRTAAVFRADRLVRFAHALNSVPPRSTVDYCDAAGDAVVDAVSARRVNPGGAHHPGCWFGKNPRPSASVAMLEEALTLACVAMLPNAVLPSVYLERYVTRPLARNTPAAASASGGGRASSGRHGEWSALLYPHAAAAVSAHSTTTRSTAAAAALTAIAAAAVNVCEITLEVAGGEMENPRGAAAANAALVSLWILLTTLAANVLAAPGVAGWLHPDIVSVLEQIGSIGSCAYIYHTDHGGHEILSEETLEKAWLIGEGSSADLVSVLREVLTQLGGRLVRLEMSAMATAGYAAVRTTGGTATDEENTRRVGEKMLAECRKLYQRQTLTPLAARTTTTTTTITATTTTAAAPSSSPSAAPTFIPFSVFGEGEVGRLAEADWCEVVDARVAGASDGWMLALQDAWGKEWFEGPVAATLHCKSSCSAWGIPGLLENVGVTSYAGSSGGGWGGSAGHDIGGGYGTTRGSFSVSGSSPVLLSSGDGGGSPGGDAADDEWEIEEKRHAAQTIQKYVRGWRVRRAKEDGTLGGFSSVAGAAGRGRGGGDGSRSFNGRGVPTAPSVPSGPPSGGGGFGGGGGGGDGDGDGTSPSLGSAATHDSATGTDWASAAPRTPKDPLLVTMENDQTLIFLRRALEAAGAITGDQARICSAPKDLWWVCLEGAHALNGEWQPNLAAGAIRWWFSRHPPQTDEKDPADSDATSFTSSAAAQGPYTHSEMREFWPALMVESAAYPHARVWQDGSNPLVDARHPSRLAHIFGPNAEDARRRAAVDFWSFAHAWGRDAAAAQHLIFHGLPEFQRKAEAWLAVAPSAEQAEATDNVKMSQEYASQIHTTLEKVNACVVPKVFKRNAEKNNGGSGDGEANDGGEIPWHKNLKKPIGILREAVSRVDKWLRENRRQLALKRGERDPEEVAAERAAAAAHQARLMEDMGGGDNQRNEGTRYGGGGGWGANNVHANGAGGGYGNGNGGASFFAASGAGAGAGAGTGGGGGEDGEYHDPWYDEALVDEDGFGLTAKEARRREKIRNSQMYLRMRQDASSGDFHVAGRGGGGRGRGGLPKPRSFGFNRRAGGRGGGAGGRRGGGRGGGRGGRGGGDVV